MNGIEAGRTRASTHRACVKRWRKNVPTHDTASGERGIEGTHGTGVDQSLRHDDARQAQAPDGRRSMVATRITRKGEHFRCEARILTGAL